MTFTRSVNYSHKWQKGWLFIYVILALRVFKNFTNLWTRYFSCSRWLLNRALNCCCWRRASGLDSLTWGQSLLPLTELETSATGITNSKYQIYNQLDTTEINLAKMDVAHHPGQEKRTAQEQDAGEASAQVNSSPDGKQDRQDTGSENCFGGAWCWGR